MKEISLNQWCAMLPNETKIHVIGEYIEDGKLTIAKEFHLVGLNTDYIEYHEIGRTVTDQATFADARPILRDLSDITKEIEFEGNTINLYDWLIFDCDSDYFHGNKEANLLAINLKAGKKNIIEFLPYGLIEILLEYKFNVFQLPDELIVKVSESFNPYK